MDSSGHPKVDASSGDDKTKVSSLCQVCGAKYFIKEAETTETVKYRCYGCGATYIGERKAAR